MVIRRGHILLGICCLFLLFLPANPGGTFASKPVFAIPASWLATGLDTSGWPTFGYNTEHSAAYPSQGPLPPLRGQRVWQQNTGGPVFSSPVLSNGTVYVGSTGGNLLALDAQTGAVRWQHAIGQFLNDSTPVVVGRVVFVGANRTWVYALDASNGHSLWATNLQEIIKAAPTYANGIVLVNSSNSATALDARTGLVRWRFHEIGFGWPTTASPTIQGQVAYVALGDKTIVYAFNLQTGRQIWAYNAGDRLISTPLVVGQQLIIGTWKGKIEAVNAVNGAQLWHYNVNEALLHGMSIDGIASSLAANNDTVFVGTYNGNIVAVDTTTGRLRWAHVISAPVLGTPVIEGNTIYVSGGQTLYALVVSGGKPLWQLALGDVRSEPALSTGRLYVATVQGYIDAVA
ncbi:MAG: PQQ-binding-like beta-propeller repeat protein [Ktedonobacteraceae bacterium]